ncbi:hypothetical protein [Burkholderia pseudomallei]|uniref:hypothetical protein n=1 Tax=Burkholderia pseudomallei TaxID=28450 RepID=UPI0019402760|nr:hypothetical protein [Burkholderia pseudomallei]MBM5584972.1 hypothetical protein [Burkholderia pseudomallei]
MSGFHCVDTSVDFVDLPLVRAVFSVVGVHSGGQEIRALIQMLDGHAFDGPHSCPPVSASRIPARDQVIRPAQIRLGVRELAYQIPLLINDRSERFFAALDLICRIEQRLLYIARQLATVLCA